MFRHAGIFVIALAVVPTVAAQSIPSQFLSTPVRLELDKPTTEVKAGSTVTYTVTLKNANGQAVAASSNLQLQIETPSGQKTVVLPAGQSAANFSWQAQTSGVGQMNVRSGNLHPATGLVLVAPAPVPKAELMMLPTQSHPAATVEVLHLPPPAPPHHLGIGAIAAEYTVVAPAAAPAAQPAPAPQPAPPAPAHATKLQLFVAPKAVSGDAVKRIWTASVSVAATSDSGELTPVGGPVQVHFTSAQSQISPADITLQPGDLSNFNNPAILTANRSGADTVTALSSLGTAGPVDVSLVQPPPTKLLINLGQPQLLGSGSSSTTVEVCLADAAGALALSPDPIQVVLNPAGQMSKSVVPIAANSPCSETVTWTASQPGLAQITAEANGPLVGSDSVTFPKFPWYFVWLAAGGGLLGAVVANIKQSFTRRWWALTWRNLLVGAVLGAVCYVLVRYGALILPKDFPVDVQKVPAVTALGSSVIGFVIGLWNRKFLKLDDDSPSPQASNRTAGAEDGGGD